MATNTSATIYLDHGYNVITSGQIVECMECNAYFGHIPFGFIYDDPAAGWRQDAEAPYVAGYCKPCAQMISAAHTRSIRDGSWYERDMEDERAMG